MFSLHRTASALVFASTLIAIGCRAQTPAPLSADLARRIEVQLREKAQLPPGSLLNISGREPSELPGYSNITVSVTTDDGKVSRPIQFLLSADGKTLAQFTKFDISANPRTLVNADNRPYRGGGANAPVLIVGFDDLECPYCAKLNAEIFPAITDRYKDQVRVVYRDFPLDQHPWAMRAAVDTNCLGAQSNSGYWNTVDYIHLHAGELGAGTGLDKDGKPEEKTLPRANDQIDKLVRDQGTFQKVDMTKLDACIKTQDTKAVEASRQMGVSLGVDSTPSLFINGDKIDGAVPLAFLFKIIDAAIVAEGKTPPAPYVAPAPPVAAPVPAAGPASK